MAQFRKKPVVIEAEQFTEENKNKAFHFVRCNCAARFDGDKPILVIQTLEGEMTASLGDWIIKGVKGEFYPCKPEIFAATYEPFEFEGRKPTIEELEKILAQNPEDIGIRINPDGSITAEPKVLNPI